MAINVATDYLFRFLADMTSGYVIARSNDVQQLRNPGKLHKPDFIIETTIIKLGALS